MKLIRKIKSRLHGKMAAWLSYNTAYHITIKDWSRITDLEVAAAVPALYPFRDMMKLQEPDLSKYKNVLVLSPHQDDESIGAGGLMSRLNKLGASILVCYTTDGAQEELGANSVELRFAEAAEALKLVNAKMHRLPVSNLKPQPSSQEVNALAKLISELDPDLILVPWLLDSPPKHRMTNHLLYLASKQVKDQRAEVWGYEVHNVLPATVFVDISSEIELKRQMLSCFKSQLETVERYDHITIGLNAWNSKFMPLNKSKLSGRYAELFMALPYKDYLSLFDTIWEKNGAKLYRNEKALGTYMASLHG